MLKYFDYLSPKKNVKQSKVSLHLFALINAVYQLYIKSRYELKMPLCTQSISKALPMPNGLVS